MRNLRKTVLFLGTSALLMLTPRSEGLSFRRKPSADFYVSPAGNDNWSGELEEAVEDGQNGPFATIGRAQRAVRELRTTMENPGPLTVMLQGGIYPIASALLFTPADSGGEDSPVIYQAYPGEKPVVSGGRRITGWRELADGTWTAEVAEVADGTWFFSQLFVNGARKKRCRLPNVGYLRITGPLAPKPKRQTNEWGSKECRSGFFFEDNDVQKWTDWQDMNVFLFHSWTTSVHWVKEIDEEKRALRFTAGSGWPVGYWDKNARYYIENTRVGLDEPGEWYLDRQAGKVVYLPNPDETLTEFEAIAPVAKQLLRLEADSALGLYVENIHFKGISFQHSAWDLPRDQKHDGQAGISLTGAIYTRGSRNCRFENIEVAHVGTYGVWFAEGSQKNTLIGSELRDLAGGGIKIGETASEKDAATACRENLVENCFIHDGGLISRAGIGVWIGRSSYNAVRHNEICDFDYSAVSAGWSWGYAASSANHNLVEYNRMHHIGNGVLSDMGGIYCLGKSPGTVLRGNVMHDIWSYSYGGWGLYTDEGSSEILMENNIVYNTKSGGFHQHYGRDNILRSNILAFSQEGQIIRSREEEHLSFTVEKNILIFDNGQPLGGNWHNGNFSFAGNLYWDVTRKPFCFSGYALEEWQEEGQDVKGMIADPRFVDAKHGDFRLKLWSPVREYGIDPKMIMAQAGLYGSKAWCKKPGNVTHRTIDTNMQAPRKAERPNFLKTIDEDFEALEIGANATFANTSGQGGMASICVTDEIAASGKHSLKFTDAEGLAYDWQPHLSAAPIWNRGTIRGSFDVMLRPGAIFWHEWRDRSSPYRIGPSLRFTAAGDLVVGGHNEKGETVAQTITTFPHNEWIHVVITCPLGKAQAGTYQLAVTFPGQESRSFGLPTLSEDWNACMCMVFVSEAVKQTEFFLDNIRFERLGKDE